MKEKIKILHLEDNALDAELIKSQLEDEGIECVITLISGKDEYLNACQSEKFDLVISDNTLPAFNGIEALKYAKNLQPLTPFIFLSGTLSENDAIEAMRWGASDYISKLTLNKLGITVKRVLHEYVKTKELEAAMIRIKESEQRFSSAFFFAPISMALVSIDGKFIQVNPALCEIVGYSESELLTKNFRDITHPADLGSDLNYVRQMLEKEITTYQMEKRYLHKLGSEVWIHLSVSLVYDDKGLPQYFIFQINDIRERKKAEKELIAAKDKAEEMNRLKTFFLHNMSHELRTPLIGIMGFAEILESEIVEPDYKDMVTQIHTSSKRLSETLNLILDLSKIEAESLNIENKIFNLSEVTRNRVTNYEETAKEKGLTLSTIIKDENISSDTDERIYTQIIDNLVNNAIKFTDSGGISVILEKSNDFTEGKTEYLAILKVIDTGIGLAEKDFNLIFEEYRQVVEGLSRPFQGSGLGLTITKKFVEKLGGKITVESKLGIGTTFTVSLPVVFIPS